jgi:hypothetical protein
LSVNYSVEVRQEQLKLGIHKVEHLPYAREIFR